MKIHAIITDSLTGFTEEYISDNSYYSNPVRNAVSHLTNYYYVKWESSTQVGKYIIKKGSIDGTQKKIIINISE